MTIPVLSRARRWVGVAVLVAAPPVLAEDPGTLPPPAEVLHGTTRVTPTRADWEPTCPALPAPEPRLVPAGGTFTDRPAPATLPLIRPEPAEHAKPGTAPQTVVVVREPVAATPAPAAPPTVVVVREPEPRAEPARPVAEWALVGAAAVGLFVGAVVLRRPGGATVVVAPPAPAAPPVPTPPLPPEPVAPAAEPEPPTIKVGGLDAGPPPNTAQKFDAGPTYQEQRKAHERQEEEKGAAVLEFILGQNLALRAAPDDQSPLAEAV